MTESAARRRIILIAVAALLLRVGFLLVRDGGHVTNGIHSIDGFLYNRLALELLGSFRYDADYPPAGYPAFLAGVYALFGPHRWAVYLVQCLLGASTVWATGELGLRLGGGRAGVVAALIVAIDYPLVQVVRYLGTESLSVFLLMAGLLTAWVSGHGGAGRRGAFLACVSGAVFGIGALVRILGYGFAVCSLPWVAGSGRWRDRGGRVLAFMVGLAFAVSPWAARCVHRHGSFNPFRGGGALVGHGFSDQATTGSGGLHSGRQVAADPSDSANMAVAEVVRDPGRSLRLVCGRVANMWRPSYATANRVNRYATTATYGVFVLCFGMVGMVLALPAARRLAPLYGVVAVTILLHSMTISVIRYRYPVEPVLAVFSGMLLSRWLEVMGRRRDRRVTATQDEPAAEPPAGRSRDSAETIPPG